MTTAQINEQVKVIEKATKNASKSKESAIKFLKEVGIISASKARALTIQKAKKFDPYLKK